DLGGEIKMDWSSSTIPMKGEMKKLFPVRKMKFTVRKYDDPRANILFQDCGLGNYFLTSQKEENFPLLMEEEEDQIWTMEFDGSHSRVGSRAGVVLYSPSNE
ncbi:hypothetical protein KI387_041532, partial [Taxus chinensis]